MKNSFSLGTQIVVNISTPLDITPKNNESLGDGCSKGLSFGGQAEIDVEGPTNVRKQEEVLVEQDEELCDQELEVEKDVQNAVDTVAENVSQIVAENETIFENENVVEIVVQNVTQQVEKVVAEKRRERKNKKMIVLVAKSDVAIPVEEHVIAAEPIIDRITKWKNHSERHIVVSEVSEVMVQNEEDQDQIYGVVSERE